MIRAPKFTANLTALYSVDVGDGKVTASGTVYYSSRIFHDPINRISQAPYTTVNAKLGWQPREGLELSVYGRNLTDKVVLAAVTPQSLGDQAIYTPPRTFGVQANIAF
jgi:outer membrane receptor protein involved in Fe transport